jgi:hypothetical protein
MVDDRLRVRGSRVHPRHLPDFRGVVIMSNRAVDIMAPLLIGATIGVVIYVILHTLGCV